MRFYLGVPEPAWLQMTDVPLFVSHRRLRRRKTMPKALGPWALDSGAFTEVQQYGRWVTTPDEYADWARRYMAEVGNLQWAAPQDMMCEPFMLEKTGLEVYDHQLHTVYNYLELVELAPDVPWAPVLQGFTIDDYHACLDKYLEVGVDFSKVPVVGVGSVCRRQHTAEISAVLASLAERGLRLHGFGVKSDGLEMYSDSLQSADSMAWSFVARRRKLRLDGDCPHRGDCRNCIRWALEWRRRLLERLDQDLELAA